MGLRIVQALLSNMPSSTEQTSPILIVCQTNHALDQFLEGILYFNQDIVRIGGRSESQLLNDYNLRHLAAQERHLPPHILGNLTNSRRSLRMILSTVNLIKKQISKVIEPTDVMNAELFETIKKFSMRQFESLCAKAEKAHNTVINEWLNHRPVKNSKTNVLAGHRRDVMTLREAVLVTNVWNLNVKERWRLYMFWIQLPLKDLEKEKNTKEAEYFDEGEVLQALRNEEQIYALRNAKVIGLTTTGAAKHRHLIDGLQPRIISTYFRMNQLHCFY